LALTNDEKDRLPATLKRSSAKAQATYIHTLESAENEHGDGEAAHRIAFASLKHSFEKVGDHWEPKTRRGPSDDQDAKTGSAARRSSTPTAGGVDAYATKAHLMDLARRLEVKGRVNGHWFLPVGGRGFSPRMAIRIPRGGPWLSPGVVRWRSVEGLDSFAGGRLGEADGVAAGHDDVGVVQEPVNERCGDGAWHEFLEP
jgi:ChaB